jgi:hypothetical protein
VEGWVRLTPGNVRKSEGEIPLGFKITLLLEFFFTFYLKLHCHLPMYFSFQTGRS